MRSKAAVRRPIRIHGSRLDGNRGCGKITRRANFRFRRRANQFYQLARLTPKEGRIAIVTNARWDAVDAAASGEQVNCRAGFGLSQTRERSNGAQTNGVCCVRQNRVVPTPVAGAKLSVAKSIQPGRSAVKPAATVTRRIRSPGSAV